MNNDNVKDFYNDFVNYQTNSGINERIYTLYKKMRSLNLVSSSNVLELGCGIGVMTKLLSNRVKEGYIEAVDLSDKSIELAKSKLDKKNISFFVGDVVNYIPEKKNYDFITLFDVIEHIPIEKHFDLFKNLAKLSDDNTKIVINIPNPEFIDYLTKNDPSSLQIIDQPIPLRTILTNAETNGLQILNFDTYSIWVENDYQFIVIQKKTDYDKIFVNDKRTILQKIKHRLNNLYIQFKYGGQ